MSHLVLYILSGIRSPPLSIRRLCSGALSFVETKSVHNVSRVSVNINSWWRYRLYSSAVLALYPLKAATLKKGCALMVQGNSR